jgi:hypothetical protein
MNGWPNEPTWRLQVHIGNDRQLHALANQAAARIAAGAATFDEAVESFAAWLSAEFNARPLADNPPTWERLAQELAETAWREVDTKRVASHWISAVRLTRDEFEHLVDTAIEKLAGVSLYDLPDVSLDDWLDENDHLPLAGARGVATDAAREILAEAGYPVEEAAHG